MPNHPSLSMILNTCFDKDTYNWSFWVIIANILNGYQFRKQWKMLVPTGKYAQIKYDQSDWEKVELPSVESSSASAPVKGETRSSLAWLPLSHLLSIAFTTAFSWFTHIITTKTYPTQFQLLLDREHSGKKHVGLHGNDHNVSPVGETATSSRQESAAAANPKPCTRTFHFSRCK